jgi:hypothetical protein
MHPLAGARTLAQIIFPNRKPTIRHAAPRIVADRSLARPIGVAPDGGLHPAGYRIVCNLSCMWEMDFATLQTQRGLHN